MTQFSQLNRIIPHIDTVFETFFDSMLKNSRFVIFFESEAQVKMLIEKQKTDFTASLEMSRDELRGTYMRLGEYHYGLHISYIDFIKGVEILQEQFILHAYKADGQTYLPAEITMNKINWLKGLLDAIKADADRSEETRKYFEIRKKELRFIPEQKRQSRKPFGVFFKEIDANLYAAKNAGKNRIIAQ